jgi:hypothetical protein
MASPVGCDFASLDEGPARLLFDLLRERVPPSEVPVVKNVLGAAAIERNEVRIVTASPICLHSAAFLVFQHSYLIFGSRFVFNMSPGASSRA